MGLNFQGKQVYKCRDHNIIYRADMGNCQEDGECVDANQTDWIMKPNEAYTPDQLHQAILCYVSNACETRMFLRSG